MFWYYDYSRAVTVNQPFKTVNYIVWMIIISSIIYEKTLKLNRIKILEEEIVKLREKLNE